MRNASLGGGCFNRATEAIMCASSSYWVAGRIDRTRRDRTRRVEGIRSEIRHGPLGGRCQMACDDWSSME